MPPAPTNPSPTILVVDDDESVLEITGRILVNAGYVVVTARDGEVAWDVIIEKRQKIDLLLTDISMPGAFDGVELAERVRERHPTLPILLMTGVSVIHERPRIVARAWQQFLLHKPFTPDVLLMMVRKNLPPGAGNGIPGGSVRREPLA